MVVVGVGVGVVVEVFVVVVVGFVVEVVVAVTVAGKMIFKSDVTRIITSYCWGRTITWSASKSRVALRRWSGCMAWSVSRSEFCCF